jgi:putative transposase
MLNCRKKLRLSRHNYCAPRHYFITICTNNRECLFGSIFKDKSHLNAAGIMMHNCWLSIPKYYTEWDVDSLIIMPNHIHAILIKNNAAKSMSLMKLMHNIKSYTTNLYMQGVREKQWIPFNKRLWQRSYYENIIRDSKSLRKIRQYVLDNPAKWNIDQNNSRPL